ncbi:MAG: helix-hairpin-helix domain-containing protein [Lewinella sp.]|jgi:predicted flap endonuclease-1-like 5' DNA nuclease|nr:helix-hairpin-helix domain-containing protein [Lewinella sp.]
MNYIFLHVNDNSFLGFHHDWWWIWSALFFAIGAIVHWILWSLLGGDKPDCSEIEAERDRYHKSAVKWETDYQSIKYQLQESQKAEADLRSALGRCEADKASMAAVTAAASGPAVVPVPIPVNTDRTGIVSGIGGRNGLVYAGLFDNDNFQIIEGVGPKVNALLLNAGYKTWSELAVTDSGDIRKHLDEAGKRFGLCDPTSWPHQAKLADAGDWDELIRYQKFTDGGGETVGDSVTYSKFEKLAAKKLGFSSSNPNDLKVVEGIGPKIEGLLKAGGINTWSELAAADTVRIQEVLAAAGARFKLAVPRTWSQQAGLAAAGNWAALKSLQEELNAGK